MNVAPKPTEPNTDLPGAEPPPGVPRVRIEGPRPEQAATPTLLLGHATDPGSARALQVAADLARRLRAHLHIVHGVGLDDYPIDPDAADWEQQAQQALTEQRDEVAAALAKTQVSWTYHASRADPVALITAIAQEHNALMIIVGSRGEGFAAVIQRLLTGSVSHGVIGSQHRPVLVVPPNDQDG